MITRQTNYSPQVAKEKLDEFGGNHIDVIQDYLGILKKTPPCDKVVSVNQEIFKQIRYKLNTVMVDYNERNSKKPPS